MALGYPIHDYRLDNGLRVVVSPDHAAPVVAVNLWYDVGSKDEAKGKTGLAHLFEHLMFQGSANVGAGEHLAIVQANGGTANATTWFDRTNYFETVPVGALELALWLEADRLGTLPVALTQGNLDNQRDVVMEEKRQRYDNVPYGDVLEHLVALTFPAQHPYGHTTIGSMDDLRAATLGDVTDFFARHYAADNAVLTLVGDVRPEQGLALADRYLGALPAIGRPQRDHLPPLPRIQGAPTLDRTSAVPADAVYLAWRVPAHGSRELDALQVGLAILGDGLTSRLHQALVRPELAEGAGASAIALIGGTSLGFAYARALPGVSISALEGAMIAEIAALASAGPTEAEVNRAIAQHEREWLSELGQVTSRADAIGAFTTLHDDPELINTRIDAVSSLTPEDVQRAVADYLGEDHHATLRIAREEQK